MDINLFHKIIDEYSEMMLSKKNVGTIALTGGNPMMHDKFWRFLEYINSKNNIIMVVMGNPNLINAVSAKNLFNFGISGFQLSLDGFEKTHDLIRSKGSFKETIEAINSLNFYGVKTSVMYTLSRKNMHEVGDLAKFLFDYTGIAGFAFDSYCPVNQADSDVLTYSELFNAMYTIFKLERHERFIIGKKDSMWKSFFCKWD